MPYEPYDTGWIKSIYGGICLAWFLYTEGCPPLVIVKMCFNNMFTPMVDQVNMLLRMIAKTIVSFGTMVVKTESLIFQNFNYIDPIFNCLQRIERLVSSANINTSPSISIRPSGISKRHNSSNNKSSSGRHSAIFHARRRLATKNSIITRPWADYRNNQTQVRSNVRTRNRTRFETCGSLPSLTIPQAFYPIDDPSYGPADDAVVSKSGAAILGSS